MNEKGNALQESPQERGTSPQHSISDDGSMNRKTKNLSIDVARQDQKSDTSPNEKKRSGQDSQSLHGSKRTRHLSDLPTRATDTHLHAHVSNQTDDADRNVDQAITQQNYRSPELKKLRQGQERTTSPTDQGGGDFQSEDITMLLQPETRPITQEQLVNEVKGIYAGLVM